MNVFQVAEENIPAPLKAWEADGNWMKQQPGYISTQLHQGIAGSTVFMNYAVWESVAHFRAAFTHPDWGIHLTGLEPGVGWEGWVRTAGRPRGTQFRLENRPWENR